MILTPDPHILVDLARIPPNVRASGFVFTSMKIRARGRFEESPEGSRFRILGWPRPIAVRGEGPFPSGPVTLVAALFSEPSLLLEPETIEPTEK